MFCTQDMFAAGSETLATAIEWVLVELVKNPMAMKRVMVEVCSVLSSHSTVTEEALGELRYLQLVIRETFRLHPPIPLLLPRLASEPCRVLGYDMPQGHHGSDFEFLPFGADRRICPGMMFGLANVELPLASLLFHFDWEAPGMADPAEINMTEMFGATVGRKGGLLLRPIIRVPVPGA
ncbi:hypothetical protein EJB05_28896, partial [Eragrostis curvula]